MSICRIFVSAVPSFIFLLGCARQSGVDLSSRPFGVGMVEAQYGNFSKSEVEAVRAALAKLNFPVAVGTVECLLPRSVKPLQVSFSDHRPDQENKGRIGGNIVEYWLNENAAVRVATAYYSPRSQGGPIFSMEEWAVLLSRRERDGFSRPIYPGDWVFVEVEK